MVDSMLYSEEMFVFLTPDASETFLTPPELLDKLKALLANQTDLPPELRRLPSNEERAQYLIETHCEFATAPGEAVQWYAVRLEK